MFFQQSSYTISSVGFHYGEKNRFYDISVEQSRASGQGGRKNTDLEQKYVR